MKQNSTHSSDSVNNPFETFEVNKSNLTEEEYALLQKLVTKSKSNFKESIPKILTPVYGYDIFGKGVFTVPMQRKDSKYAPVLCEQYYKAGILQDSPENAQESFDKYYVIGQLNYLSRNSAEPYNPWDGKHRHYFIAYYPDKDELTITSTTNLRSGVPYFASHDAAYEAMLTIGADNIKKALTSNF